MKKVIKSVILYHHPERNYNGCKSKDAHTSTTGDLCRECANNKKCRLSRKIYFNSGEIMVLNEEKEFDIFTRYIMRIIDKDKNSAQILSSFEFGSKGDLQSITAGDCIDEAEYSTIKTKSRELKKRIEEGKL